MNDSISIRNLEKSFASGTSTNRVLKDVSFEARKGEMLFLVGPSGCGKTTLLSVLCGTLAADAGEIAVLGSRLDQLREPALTRFRARHVGFVFQQFNLIPTLTITDNVAVPLIIQGRSTSSAWSKARAALERVGLGDKVRDLPSKLSGGQQQRVAIARAIVHEPDLIICDEPTSALDSKTGHQILDLLKEAASDPRRTVIVVTHDQRIYGYADRLAEMEDGCIQRVLQSPQEIACAYPS